MKKMVKVVINGETYYKETDDHSTEGVDFEDTEIEFDENQKGNKIINLLPFMSKEDLHSLTDSIIQNSSKYENINVENIFPFLSQEDSDKIFVHFISKGENNLTNIAPFVSRDALHEVVVKYVNGELENIDISFDNIYPFLASSDIKLLFEYLLEDKDEKEN